MKAKQNGKTKILIAEDSRTQAEQLGFILEQHGYQVTIAANGKLALQAAQAQEPDLILSDIVMPEMDGYELCKAIKSDEKSKEIPVILVTSLSDSQDVIRGLECGADNFIRKPYDEQYLVSRIDYLLMNLELRKNQKMQMGMEINLFGQKYFINSERQQILDLLISTYEQAVHINGELKQRENELAHSNEVLNGLYRIAEGLNHAVSEQQVAELALERALELPGIVAGWVYLRDGDTRIRLAATRNLPPALQTLGALEGNCQCQHHLQASELDATTRVIQCERLARAKGDTRGLRFHASVPLWLGGRALGTMNLVGPEDGVFNDLELKMLYGVGNQVAVALERARLHEHLEQLVEERTAALRASEARLRTIIEAEPECVKIVDADGRVVQMNAAGLAMIDADSLEQVQGRDIADFVVPQHREGYRAFEASVLDGKSAAFEFEIVGLKGTRRWLETHAVPLDDPQDGRLQMLAIGRNITQRKLAETMLRVSEEKFRAIFEGTVDGVLIADAESKRFATGNPAICSMLGYSLEELVMLGVADIHPQPDLPHVIEQFEGQLRGETQLAADLPVRRKDGSVFYADIKSSSVKFGDKTYLVGVFRDITQRKENEARIARLNRIYAVLSGINTAIVRALEEGELFRQACRIAVEHGKFTFAWIGKFDADNMKVTPVARAGRDDGYLAQLLDAPGSIKGSCTLTTQALTELKPVVCNDIAGDDRMAACRSEALSRGYRSVAVFPLMVELWPVGMFALYAPEAHVFDDEEMRLLTEMSVDINYALDNFSREAKRREAEDALANSRNLFKAVVDTSPLRIFWKDTQLRYMGCNPAFARDAGGAEPEDVNGKDDFQLPWKERAELYRADDRQVMDSGIAKLSYDETFSTPDGKTNWVRTSKVPLRNAANETIGVLGIYEDITARKQTELALQRSEADLNRAQAVAQVGSWSIDLASNRIVWSAEAYRIYGIPEHETADEDKFLSAVHPEDRDGVLAAWNAAVKGGAPYDIEHRIVANGETRWVRERAIFEKYDEEGIPLIAVGTTQDITDRKQAEDELRKLSLAVEQSPNAIVITDLNAELEYVNEAFVKVTGYSRAEAIGRNPSILHSGKNSRATYDDMWAHLTRGEVWKGELINRRKNGSEYVEAVLISPVRDSNGKITHYLGIKEDITERKLAESKLAEQFDELRRWHEATLGREMRAMDLKREVNELLGKAGKPPRYPSAEED